MHFYILFKHTHKNEMKVIAKKTKKKLGILDDMMLNQCGKTIIRLL